MAKVKALKVSISGSYRNSKNEAIDFDNLSGVIPYTTEEHAKMHVRGRYAAMWITNAKDKDGNKLYKDRLDSLRQVFIDSIEETEAEFSFIGKDIKQMSYDELQDLATAKDLRRISLPKELSGVDLREMRSMAYMDYASKILGMNDTNRLDPKRPIPVEERINPLIEGYDFAKLPPLKADGGQRVDNTKKITNEEMLELEANTTDLTAKPGSNLTLASLRKIADEKGIKYHATIGFDALYEKIFGTAPGASAA